MAMLNTVAKMVAKPMPRMISPGARSVTDFILAGSFLAGAAWFWSRNKRAAVAALLCGGAELGISLLTHYPGKERRPIKFGIRRDIDLGLAAMTATMPEFMAFGDESEKKFFMTQGAIITALAELTKFPERPQQAERRTRRAHAA